jgi:hypothetical protein
MNVVSIRDRIVKFWALVNKPLARRSFAMAVVAVLGNSFQSNVDAGIVTAGSSSAYAVGATIDVTLLSAATVDVNIANQPTASGTSPSGYSSNNTAASVTGSVPGVAVVSGSVLGATATSNVTGSLSSGTTFGSSTITGLGVSVGPGGNLLSITSGSDVITESSTASGSYGSLSASGALTIVGSSNIIISVLGIQAAEITVGEVIAPNTKITLTGLLAGLGSITLNEQIADPGSNGTTSAGITSNFLDLSLSPSLSLGLLGTDSASIDIIVDHSHAAISASSVPEPSSIALAGIGILAVFGTTVVRRRFA